MEISILMLTYNHKKYVRQALESIFKQKIKVSYEILVLDDASTDGTQDILKEYKSKYPDIVSLYLREKNVYHPTRNGYFLTSKAKGRYIAILEGDDFWIDTQKLQKQYDFLEKHREFSACVTDLVIVDENNTGIAGMEVYEKMENHIYTLQDFSQLKMPGMVVTMMARNYFNPKEYSILMKASKNMGDITRFMLLVLKGHIYQLEDKTAAYRYVSVEGRNNFNSINKGNRYRDYIGIRYWIKLENYMKQNYDKNFEIIPIKYALQTCLDKYSIKSMIHLISESHNKKKYLMVFLIYKYLLDSNFLVKSRMGIRSSWKRFVKKRYPLVLFGAGAVAEEYLDKYGWKGNILFIVDNDKSKHNTSFKGYLIKNSEEILKYKNKVSVLITNKDHEKDIAEQLSNMGISRFDCYCSMQSGRVRNILAMWFLERL
jgi:glycosyltransferase involved in cell wall biosynthesis